MDEIGNFVGSTPVSREAREGQLLAEDRVREILNRLERGEGIKTIARELGVDRKTVKRWRRVGGWKPRTRGTRRRALDPFAGFLEQRGPEVGWNGSVLLRELRALGFEGGYLQVQRFVRPLRDAKRWATVATVRFETEPGRQAQVDYGQMRVWIGEGWERIHLFVFTLGYSRRLFVQAYRDERLGSLLDGHERAFRQFAGVPLECLYDNPRTVTLGREAGRVLWHPVFEDFARYWGFTPRVCQPYRARTKGKVESGVKYVKRNALAGRRFHSFAELEAWLAQWSAEVADVRTHGTTFARPIDRFAAEGLTAIGERAPYRFERVRLRVVPSDALVSIAASRYSVPVRFVGETVRVHETADHYEIYHREVAPIARHAKAGRHAVVMERAHYQGLLRPGAKPGEVRPPRFDPRFLALGGEVAIRGLDTYAEASSVGGVR
jgi:transposase